jgi:hypothetical protein
MSIKRFESLHISVNANGVVRVYGNGGMIFESQADYVRVETLVDSTPVPASGIVPKVREGK